jgi:hypothetical protein
VHSCAAIFTSLGKLSKYAGGKLSSSAKLAYIDFSSSDFNVQGHVLSSGGDALIMGSKKIYDEST